MKEDIWRGPVEDGITFSLLSRWVVCRERFRLLTIEGLKEDEGFIDAIEFGSLWHEAEEASANGKDWEKAVNRYANRLRGEHLTSLEQIDKWTHLVRLVFPLYLDHWKSSPSTRGRTPILQERSFRIPYPLPSGRTITLRGKFDSVWKKGKGIWLQENKTKGTIDEEGILKTLAGNLQVMIYLISLRHLVNGVGALDDPSGISIPRLPVRGVIYNVIRRPLSARNSIRPRKSETPRDFHSRFRDTVADNPEDHFFRWEASIYRKDLEKFEAEVFHPLLESFLDWWEWVSYDPNPWRVPTSEELSTADFRYNRPPGIIPGGGIHFQAPWGVYSSLASGFRGDYFNFLSSGSRVGLVETETLFPELETGT